MFICLKEGNYITNDDDDDKYIYLCAKLRNKRNNDLFDQNKKCNTHLEDFSIKNVLIEKKINLKLK